MLQKLTEVLSILPSNWHIPVRATNIWVRHAITGSLFQYSNKYSYRCRSIFSGNKEGGRSDLFLRLHRSSLGWQGCFCIYPSKDKKLSTERYRFTACQEIALTHSVSPPLGFEDLVFSSLNNCQCRGEYFVLTRWAIANVVVNVLCWISVNTVVVPQRLHQVVEGKNWLRYNQLKKITQVVSCSSRKICYIQKSQMVRRWTNKIRITATSFQLEMVVIII